MASCKVIIVTGCRDWTNRARVWSALIRAAGAYAETILFHGGCPTGADAAAAHFAKVQGVAVHAFPAKWSEHGKRAGPIRNREMCAAAKAAANINHADIECLAFWDGKSKGTLDCIKQAVGMGVWVEICPRGDS